MIIVRAITDEDKHFLIDARYMGIGTVCRCIARLPSVEFTKPLQSCWRVLGFSKEDESRDAIFTFKGHSYIVDDDCPFTSDIDVRSEDAPLADLVAIQDHVERTAISPFRRRLADLMCLEFRKAFGVGPRKAETGT